MDGMVEYVDIVRYECEVGFGYARRRLEHPDSRDDYLLITGPVAMFPNGEICEYMLQGKDAEYCEILPDSGTDSRNP